jgi:hypothetical protein
MSGPLTPEERAKLQRDSALNTAADATIDRDIAEAQAKAALNESMLLESEARAARHWGAQSAVEKTNAERVAEGARSEARTSTAGFFIVLTMLIVIGVISLIVYANRTTTVVENPPIQRIINVPAQSPAPVPATTVINQPSPAPPANVTINQAPAPSRAEPPTTIIVQPPAIATGNGSSPRNQNTPNTDTTTNSNNTQTTTDGSSQ